MKYFYHLLKPLAILFAIICFSTPVAAYDFMVDGIAYNKNGDGKSVTVTYERSPGSYPYISYSSLSGNLVIPKNVSSGDVTYSVTSIGYGAFYNCSGMTSVTIPNTVTTIGDEAFRGTGLISVTIPNSVKEIGGSAFIYCSSLTSISIPNSVSSIGSSAFCGCIVLTNITIPNSVTTIPSGMFYDCSGLTGITIPNSVKEIGGSAFYQCSGLKSVTIPNSVISIGEGAFYNCGDLTSVTIGNSVTSIGEGAFYNCSGLTSVIIPNSVTFIGGGSGNYDSGNGAFQKCTGLKNLTIPGSVTYIGSSAFRGCNGLMTVKIGNSTESTVVEDRAFLGCEGLTKITLPASLTSLGEEAFSGCTGLTDVICLRPRPISIDASVFKNVPVNGGCDLHVPAGSEPRYRAMDVWKDFLFIEEDAVDEDPTPTPKGDVNGDGRVNVSDVSALINIILGIS